MNIDKLNKANYLRGIIINLKCALKELKDEGYNGICTWSSDTKYHSAYGHVIKDFELREEIKQLIKNKPKEYQHEFDEL